MNAFVTKSMQDDSSDDFKFCGSTSSQFRQIGNAVAVDFAYHLGKVLKDFQDGKLKAKYYLL